MNYAIQAAQNYSKRKNRKDNDSTQKGAAVSEQERQEAVTRLQNGVEQRTQILQPATRYATARQVYRKTGEELANSQYDTTYNDLKLYTSGKKTDKQMKSKYGFDDIDLNYYKTNWDKISSDRRKSKLTQKALDMSDDDYKELSQAYSYQNPDNPVIGAIQKLFNNDPTAKVKDKLNLDDDDMDFYMNNWKSVENARKNNEEHTAKDEYEEKWNSKSDDIKDKIRAYEKESDNIAEYNQTGVQPGYTYNSPSIGGTPVIAGTNITKNDKKEELRQQLLDSGLTEDDLKYYDKNFGTIEDMEKTNAAVERQEEALKNLQETDRELFDEYDKAQALMETPSFGSNAGYNVQTSYATEKIAKAKEKLEKAGWDTESDEFRQMLEYVSRDNNRKETEQLQDTIKSDSQTLGGRIGWNAADLITHPVSGIAAAVENVKSNFYQDKDLPVDTNSPYYAATNIGQTTEGETSRYLNDKYGDIAGQAYGVGISSAKSLESMAIGGAMSKALGLTGKSAEVASALVTDSQFGLSSAAQGIQQAQDSGMGRQRAVEYGIAQGIAEAMFEHLSAENAIGLFSKASKGEVKSIIGEMAKSFMYEGSEEAFTDIANYMSDRVINGDFSDYDLKMKGYMKSGLSENEARFKVLNEYAADVAQDFTAGGLSGVLIGGGTMAAGKINYRSAAKVAVSNENLSKSIEKTALEMPEESTARKIVEAKQSDNLSTKEMASILESMTEYSNDNDLQSVLEQEFIKAGNDKQTAKKNAQLIYDMASENPEEVSEIDNDERVSQFSKDDSLPEVYGKLLKGKIDDARTVTDVQEALYNTQAEQQAQSVLKKSDRKNGSTVARAAINDTPVIVVKVNDANKSTVMLSNGQNVNLERVKEYGSTYDVSDLQHNLKNIFAYLKDTQNVSFEDMTKVMKEVAKPVLEQSTQIDESQKQDYEQFKNYLSKYKIKLNKGQREAVEYTYDNYNDFRKSMFGTLTLSNNGTYLDDIWGDIVEQSGYRLSYDTPDSDQIIELVDLLESMKPQRVNKYGMNIDNAAYDVALDIYRQFFVEQAAEGANSKVNSKIAELKSMQAEIRKKYSEKYLSAVKKERLKTEEMQKVSILRLQDEFYRLEAEERKAITNSDLINAAVLKAEKEKAQNQIRRIREQKNEKIADIRARNFASRTNAAKQRKATYLKGQIKKRMNELNSMLTHPTESKHVPVEMVRGVVDVCKVVNLDNGNSELMKERLDKLKKYYDAYNKDKNFEFDYDENISQKIGRLSEIFSGRHYMQLNNNELQEVYNIVSAVKQQISNANKLIANKKVQEVHEAAKMAVKELEAGKGINNIVQEKIHKYATVHLNARREFRKLSGYEDDSVIMSMYNQLEEGQKKQLEVERHVCDVYEDLMDDRANMKKLVSTKEKDLVDVGLKDDEGNPVKVTKAMRLSIIMHSYNKSNMYHILNDGFTVPDLKLYEKGKTKEAWKNAKTYRYLSYNLVLDALKSGNHELLENESAKYEKSIRNLEKDLSPFEKEFLKASKEVFHKYFGDEINKVSLATRGYEVARTKNYFPIRTDTNFTKTTWGNLVKDATIEGSGFLKERVKSKNPILLEDITEVLTRQTASTARYVAYAVPVRNWNMLINSTFHDESGNLKSVKNSLSKHWGSVDENYLKNIIDDIQGGRHTQSTIADKLRSGFAGSTLTLNVSVAMKQAASYPTAGAVVGYRPLMLAMKDIGKGFITQKGIEELERRNPYLWTRTEGNARSRVADVTENSKAKNKVKGGLDWITAMDVGTVRTLEYAAKYYVDIHNKELQKGSEAYWDKVSDVFTKIVTETQPNYTKLHQADITRNPNALLKQIFMFKTQSLQNFGIMYDAIGEYTAKMKKYKADKNTQTKAELRKATGNLFHAISSQIVAAAVFSGMTILAKTFYHKMDAFKDEDGNYDGIKVRDFFFSGMADTFAGCLLMGQEIYEEFSALTMGDKCYTYNLTFFLHLQVFQMQLFPSEVKNRQDHLITA